VNSTGHCAFKPAETIAALHALEHRISTGHWDAAASPEKLGGRYVKFLPPPLTGSQPGR
jgi:hypothetical protein